MNDKQDAPVYFVVPDQLDDFARVSGGNVYDQHLRDELRRLGWDVRMLPIPDTGGAHVAKSLATLPGGAVVLIDGLVAVRESEALTEQSARLRLLVLEHMVATVLADQSDAAHTADNERRALDAARGIIATSQWTRFELIARGMAEAPRIVVAQPGTAEAPVTAPSDAGGRLLCIGVVAPHKGQNKLVRALTEFSDVGGWSCTFVGSLDEAPGFVEELTRAVRAARLTDRIRFTGVLTGRELADEYRRADLVVAPSRTESFGMAVTEALAHGIPVLATRVGGLPEAIGESNAGVLVPPDDPWALHVALRYWWTNRDQRATLRAAALRARETRRDWSVPAAIVAAALNEVASTGDNRSLSAV